ncbi:MAG: Eco57I restriction-modification methylase domain-containing protein [Aeriscardovia sp.]|nr:Eco57I restriction-modification methylase domain-containing protein [Aeriscardovia sp.]
MEDTGVDNAKEGLFPFSFSLDKIRCADSALYSELLKILLSDRSRKRNIIWATDAYGEHAWSSPICQSAVSAIRPRAFKGDVEKQARVKTHAEVFTPFEIVARMTEVLWEEAEGRDKTYLEITCGEAPFITSRYDAATGNPVPLEERVGILDRKLQEAGKTAEDDEDWVEKAEAALKSVYGYEFQGDSLFIARVNVLDAFLENFEARFHRLCDRDLLLKEANIISWNFWQMDGRTQSSPVKGRTSAVNDLFNDNPPCRIRFWNQSRSTLFSHIRLEERKGMKRFYAVIGNPPYQSNREKTSDESIYNYFMDAAYKVADKVELITPARFLSYAGDTPIEWDKKLLNDTHFKILKYYSKASTVFPGAKWQGGVCISLRDEKKDFGPIEYFTPFVELTSIKNKVRCFHSKSLSEFIYLQNRFSKLFFLQRPDVVKLLKNPKERRLTTNIFSILDSVVFFEQRPSDALMTSYIKVIGLIGNNERTFRFIRKEYIEPSPNLEKYKVILPKSNGSGALGEALSTPLIGYTQSFIGIGSFDTEQEAEACLKYVKSKFARAMLGILKVTQHNPKDTWRYVPWQDFTPSSDIDWNQPIPDIDRQLYKKYGLSPEEIAFIESNVKEME